MTPDSLAELFDAFNRHDRDRIMAHFADDAVFYAVAGDAAHGVEFRGKQAIGDAFEGVWKAMPDAEWADHRHFVVGDRAVSEWTFRGTDAQGMRVEAQGADLFTHSDSLITVKQAFRKARPPYAV